MGLLLIPTSLFLLAFALSPPTLAQCTYLGAPGFTGCAPGGGIAPGLLCLGAVQVGTNLSLFVSNPTPFTLYSLLLLVGDCSNPAVPAPTGSPVCPPSVVGGCFAFLNPGAAVPVPPSPGPIPWFFSIPNDAALVGQTVCAQAVGNLSNFCLAVTNGLSITILL
ncbi:MAG TPA: hypothetical protein VFI25_12375 [Planctomycetota bacterium]|jgi:hypothetical protein|nr:hypothetical protein [Planctomycetota bacterium]